MRASREPCSRARPSRCSSSRRPRPRPRADSASHIRLMSVTSPGWCFTAPQPDRLAAQVHDDERADRRPHLVRVRRSSPSSGSNPRSGARRFSSATYARRQRCASGSSGSTARDLDQRRRRSAARPSAWRPRARRARSSSSGSRIEAASSSLRSSRIARSASPFSVSRATRTRPSASLGVTVTSPSDSSARSIRLICPESTPSRERSITTSPPSVPTSHSSRETASGRAVERKSSLSAPTRCVTVRLNRRTCATCEPIL